MNRYFRNAGTVVAAILLMFLFFYRCANIQGSLEGGPKDTIPPHIVGISPANNSVNARPKQVTITFDEYVQVKDLQKEFFTSPFMNKKPTVLSNGKSVIVDIRADLDTNTTYVLNLGQSVKDNNELNSYVGLRYAFSTGPAVDSMYISGFVSDAKSGDTMRNSFVFFYDARIEQLTDHDSILLKYKPTAVGRTAPNGVFIHENLKPIDYRIYAVVDNNGNQSYDPGEDEVAFLDSLYNPANMPSFHMWYDSTEHYYIAEPQLFLRTFKEVVDKRQNLTSFRRPLKQKVTIAFAARNPVIESLRFDGIDSTKIIVEQMAPTRDSAIYWLDLPVEELADTINAEITYLKPDSMGVLYSHTEQLALIYIKPFVSEKEKRAEARKAAQGTDKEFFIKRWIRKCRERRALKRSGGVAITVPVSDSTSVADTSALLSAVPKEIDEVEEVADSLKPASKMEYSWITDSPVVPSSQLKLRFNLPVRSFDTKKVTLTRTDIKKVESKIPVKIERDTLKIRDYIFTATLLEGDNYQIMIPAEAIETLDGEVNDTIRYGFGVADGAKFAKLIVNLKGGNPGYRYSVAVTDTKGTEVHREIKHVSEGKHALGYITPGKVMLRVLEDRNNSGEWDAGNLIKRIHPEKISYFINPKSGTREIITRANWENEFDVDLDELFREPVHTSKFDHLHHQDEPQPADENTPEESDKQTIVSDEKQD